MDFEGRVGPQTLSNGSRSVYSLSRNGSVVTQGGGGYFQEAVDRGAVFAVANQTGVASQAGLSATTPVLTLYNPAGSGKNLVLWYAGCVFEVAPAAAASVFAAVGSNTIAAAVTGTLTTAHRNLKIGLASEPAARTFLAATLPAAPVAVAVLGVNLTGAITTTPAVATLGRWFNGAVILTPGTNFSLQTSTASGAAAMLCEYLWEEVTA